MIPFDKLEPYSKYGEIKPGMFAKLFVSIRTVARHEDYTYLYRRFFRLYQMSPYWEALREKIIERQNNTCFDCCVSDIENVHHLNYNNVGNEKLSDLVGLCNICHGKRHKKNNLPKKQPSSIGDILKTIL